MIRFEAPKLHTALLISIALLVACGLVHAQNFSHILSFQGRLCELDTGKPLPDGAYEVKFTIYDAETGGNALWQETQNVDQIGGVFNVYLGSVVPFPAELFTNGDLWLALQITNDEEMPDRFRLTPSPWAIHAAGSAHAAEAGHAIEADYATDADMVDGRHADEFASYPLKPDCVYSDNIVDLEVKTADLGNDAVNVDKLAHNINAMNIGFNADMVDGKHASAFVWWSDVGNNSGNVPISNGQKCSNLYAAKADYASDSDRIDGHDAGNSFGQVAVNNGTKCTSLNADLWDGYHWGDKYPNADKVDGYDAGNSSGQVAVSNTTKCTNLNADLWDGYHWGSRYPDADKVDGYDAGNSSGQVAVSNGTKCTNLNADLWDGYNWGDKYPDADKVDGYHAGNSSGRVAVSNGTKCSTLHADLWDSHSWGDKYPDADKLDGYNYDNLPYAPTSHSHWNQSWSGSGYGLRLDSSNNIGLKAYTSAEQTAVLGTNRFASGGAGVAGLSNNGSTYYVLEEGNGVSGTGSQYGVLGYATLSGNNGQAGGYFAIGTGDWARVCSRTTGGTHYKIRGTGSVSTVMPTSEGLISLVCPESPEAWFEDFGSTQLTNGRCYVELDPTFLECVTITEEDPLKVFIQLTSPLSGQFYVEKDQTGFSVIVVGDTTATATFDYRVVATRRGWEDIRFDSAEGPARVVPSGESLSR